MLVLNCQCHGHVARCSSPLPPQFHDDGMVGHQRLRGRLKVALVRELFDSYGDAVLMGWVEVLINQSIDYENYFTIV